MKNMIAITLATIVLTSGSAFAADRKVSREDRQKMADVHTKMAECLKSNKAMTDCQSEMMRSCKSMMGKEGCPMMGHMQGMMKGDMMNPQSDETSSQK